MRFVVIFFIVYIYELYSFPQEDTINRPESCASDQTRCIFGVYDYGVSTKDRVLIVDKHNEYRQQIAENYVPNQPRGVDLMKLKYDSHLAVLAQRVADKCHFGYSKSQQDEMAIGENLFMTMAGSYEDKPNWTEAIENWWSQHDMYLFGGEIVPENRHYVQMVWAKTSRIGCGYVAFPLKCGHFIYYRFYVCNYAPGITLSGDVTYPYKNESGLPSTPCYELCN
ncbi:cysteine-rich venom protein LIO1-like [Coccinella septempunctata]|uniref:cysteine-rich venom protein LIO1-like n=1 Tax=Coccinella septempunctata TaxID=41139 RepID=UPI001D07EFFB|nr:cysteine-rich venom protein LIO1-like [Coccinella septempunctata]